MWESCKYHGAYRIIMVIYARMIHALIMRWSIFPLLKEYYYIKQAFQSTIHNKESYGEHQKAMLCTMRHISTKMSYKQVAWIYFTNFEVISNGKIAIFHTFLMFFLRGILNYLTSLASHFVCIKFIAKR